MTFIRSFNSYVNCERAVCRVGMVILVYLRLKLSLSSLAMMFIASAKDFFVALATQAAICMDLIGLVLPLALGGFCEWRFLGHDSFLLHSVKWYVQHCLPARSPRFSFARLRFSPARENIINQPYSITPPLQ